MLGKKILGTQIERFIDTACQLYVNEEEEEYVALKDVTDNIAELSKSAKGMRMQSKSIKDAIGKELKIIKDEETGTEMVLKKDVKDFLIQQIYKRR